MRKIVMSSVLLTLIICSLVLVSTIQVGNADSGTQVSGVITNNMTWSKANSPYYFTAPVDIAQGVTVTIEPGVTINLGTNLLQVDGTLRAIGTTTEPIFFNGSQTTRDIIFLVIAEIDFTSKSAAWNTQTNSGCIIANAVFNNTRITINSSPWICNSTINGPSFINIPSGAPVISNNRIFGCGSGENYGISCYGNATISGNLIANWQRSNIITKSGSPIIKNNLILNCGPTSSTSFPSGAITLGVRSGALVENNTITASDGASGILISWYSGGNSLPIIKLNNIYGNGDNFRTTGSINYNVSNNWWGTTDAQAIAQTIIDYNDNFNLGNVTLTPYLNAPNLQAPTFINATSTIGGSISPCCPNGAIMLNVGDNQTFAMTPNTGYHILDVLVNGTSVGTVSSYTLQNITGPSTVYATFAINPTPTPTIKPTVTPTPTPFPTAQPTITPTPTTIASPTPNPTQTQAPTGNPTINPTTQPTTSPTTVPTQTPTNAPSPSVPEIPSLEALLLLMIPLSLAIVLIEKRRNPKFLSFSN